MTDEFKDTGAVKETGGIAAGAEIGVKKGPHIITLSCGIEALLRIVATEDMNAEVPGHPGLTTAQMCREVARKLLGVIVAVDKVVAEAEAAGRPVDVGEVYLGDAEAVEAIKEAPKAPPVMAPGVGHA